MIFVNTALYNNHLAVVHSGLYLSHSPRLQETPHLQYLHLLQKKTTNQVMTLFLINNEKNCSREARVYYLVQIQTVSLDESKVWIVGMQRNDFLR